MEDTATPETGPVDAPASIESIVAEIEAGGEAAPSELEAVTDELVNEAEGNSDSEQEPATQDDATETADGAEAEEAEGSEEDATQDEATYTVKVNGEERQVPLSELLNGYSRTEDYKQKTAAVAEQRRQAEAAIANADTEAKARYANQLEEATNLFAQYDPVLQEAQRIDWAALKQADPAAYVQAQDAVNARLTAIQQMQDKVKDARSQSEQRQQEMAAQERAQRFDMAADEIVKANPDLADEAKFKDFAGNAVETLKAIGFSGEEIADALDHRVLTLADKARRWDAHVAAQKSLPEKKVVPKSGVKALTTDGTGSRAPKPRFPANATGESKVNWIANQILSEV